MSKGKKLKIKRSATDIAFERLSDLAKIDSDAFNHIGDAARGFIKKDSYKQIGWEFLRKHFENQHLESDTLSNFVFT